MLIITCTTSLLMLQTRRSRLITFADEFQILGYFLKAMAIAENISISMSTKLYWKCVLKIFM